MRVFDSNFIKNNARIGLWKIDESEDELIVLCNLILTNEEKKVLKKFTNTYRRCQWMAVRRLLWEMLGADFKPITYLTNGKPMLEGKEISITHTLKFAAVIIFDTPCGIDIELPRPTIVKLKHRFLSNTEMSMLSFWKNEQNITTIELLTLLWASKEALFKMLNDNRLNFSQHLNCIMLTLDTLEFEVNIDSRKNRLLKCKFTKILNHYLVYVTD